MGGTVVFKYTTVDVPSYEYSSTKGQRWPIDILHDDIGHAPDKICMVDSRQPRMLHGCRGTGAVFFASTASAHVTCTGVIVRALGVGDTPSA